jgi:hypothetical protein
MTEPQEVLAEEVPAEEVPEMAAADKLVPTLAERPTIAAVTLESFEQMMQIGDHLIMTEFLPKAFQIPAQVVAVVLTGQELGIPMMQSLRQIRIIKKQPALAAELMLALFFRAGGRVQWLRADEKIAQAKFIRKNGDEYVQTFSDKDAKGAGLIHDSMQTGDSWVTYRPAMLRARCISAAGRAFFPDIIGGLYTPEELESVSTGEMVDGVQVHTVGAPPEPIRAHEPMSKEQEALIRKLIRSHVFDDGYETQVNGKPHAVEGDRDKVLEWLSEPRTRAEASDQLNTIMAALNIRKEVERELKRIELEEEDEEARDTKALNEDKALKQAEGE